MAKESSKSNAYCCVYGCNSLAKRSPHLSFHYFPKPGSRKVEIVNKFGDTELVDKRLMWERNLKMGKTVTKYMRVCSLHFSENDYKLEQNTGRKDLKKFSIPTKNLPVTSHPCAPAKKRVHKQEPNIPAQVEISDFQCNEELIDTSQPTCDEIEAAEAMCLLATQKTFKDVSTQVNTISFRTICDNITTDAELNSFTGLDSFAQLSAIEELCRRIYNENRVHRLLLRERIIMTLIKLKNDISYVILSILFGNVSSQTCKNIFFDMLSLLATVLDSVIFIPSQEEIRSNLPKCFAPFPNVRLIFDCTEIEVASAKCLCCRIRCYSHYKGRQTLKFLIGVTPAGLISFVSRMYGGRASDKAIFEQSGVIEHLSPYIDEIMVDKGFLIEEFCESQGIKIIRPPFLRKKKQLTKEESLHNLTIARARVHIERVNQRLKIFKILKNRVDWNIVPKMEEIITVISGIVNLSKPIFSEDKF